MKNKAIFIILILNIPFCVFGQHQDSPKNLKSAVTCLNQIATDSLKYLIRNYGNDTIKEISYPWGGDFKTIFNWTSKDNRNSRIKKYLKRKGVAHHQIEVVLISFKDYLNNNEFDEDQILFPFQVIEDRWRKEDDVRYSTDSLRGVYIPKDLGECFVQIDEFWEDSTKLKFKNWTENEFISYTHLGFGMWIRNNWQLWAGSRLSKYFNTMDIIHPDDMSGIILSSYHRYLNSANIKLAEQIEYYKEYWKEAKEKGIQEEKKRLQESMSYFDEYQLGDTLEFNYNLGFSTQEQENNWMDDSCLAKGVLLEKQQVGLKLKVKVIQSCDKKGLVYYSNEEVRVFDKKEKRWVAPRRERKKIVKTGKSRWFELDDWELE